MIKTRTGFAGSARFTLLAGAAALALPGIAHAQSAEAQEQVDVDSDSFPVASDAETGNQIVVTATKREQTLQDVPVAVSVTTAETIERAQIRDVTDLASVVPSLRVTQSQSQFATTYSIRGFGTSGNNIGLEPSVAVFVDGVYRSRAIAQISDLPDIQRVEVLRGPQSTLFGKNASAGVISIVTKDPSYDFGGSVEASYGNYDAFVAKGYLTGGLTDTIAASLAGGYNRRDGYLTNAFNGDDVNNRNRWFARGQLKFEPSDALKVRLIADYDEIDEKCCGVTALLIGPFTQVIQSLGGRVNDPNRPFDNVIYSDVVPNSRVKNWGVSGQADYEMGPVTLTSITAYRTTELNANQDVDFTSLASATGANIGQAKIETFTQELRFASDFDGPLNFLVGGYYFNEKADSADQIVYGPGFRGYANSLITLLSQGQLNASLLETYFGVPQNTYWQAGQGFFNHFTQDNEAYSLFGNVDFEITDALTLTLGANYTHDAKDVVSDSRSTDAFSNVNLVTAGAAVVRNQVIAQQVGAAIGLPAGSLASPAQIGAFAVSQPTIFAAINTGATNFANANATNPAVNSFLGLSALQFLPPLQNIPNAVEDGKSRDSDWSWTARLAYEISPTLNAYVSYATGFKASSWNLSRDSRPLAADYAQLVAQNLAVTNLRPGTRFALPENSTVYELGLKGDWGRIASANLTFFKQSITNFQTNTFVGASFVFANAPKQSTFGIEFDGRVSPTRDLSLFLAMTYLEPKYDSFPGSPLGDLSGREISNIPKIAASFGMQYDKELSGGNHLIFRGDYNYQSPVQVEEGFTKFGTPAAGILLASRYRREVDDLNASLTFAMQNGLELSVWGRNILNDRYITGMFDSVAQDGSLSGYINQPRTYGVAARFKF
ncbi:TonB-dependent receptor [Tsuneonella sp. YG55]|uniref:TonB-dependent receptor n=1 Tax=Tsuneonella litorea TaxID=2976475 RepID=A0A9X3A877_9SPHN|nr:TonB-dependent receptor [Tsuneonella litorea]MCT2559171.1 TonB-dependent receptor [Tsuneonella litorea]